MKQIVVLAAFALLSSHVEAGTLSDVLIGLGLGSGSIAASGQTGRGLKGEGGSFFPSETELVGYGVGSTAQYLANGGTLPSTTSSGTSGTSSSSGGEWSCLSCCLERSGCSGCFCRRFHRFCCLRNDAHTPACNFSGCRLGPPSAYGPLMCGDLLRQQGNFAKAYSFLDLHHG